MYTLQWAKEQYIEGETLLDADKDLKEALSYFQAALEVFEQKNEVYNALLSHQKMGEIYIKLFEIENARVSLEKAYSLQNQYNCLGALELGLLYFSLADVSDNTGKFQESYQHLQSALTFLREATDEDENVYISNCYNNLGFVCGKLGDYLKQLDYHQKNLPIRMKLFGEFHTRTGVTVNNIGISYAYLGDYQRSIEHFQKALSIQKVVLQVEIHPEIARLYNNIGYCLGKKGEYEQALYHLQKALSIRKKVFPKGHGEILQNMGNIATMYHSLKKDEKALEVLLKIIEQEESAKVLSHYGKHDTYIEIANSYFRLQQIEQAIHWGEKALELVIAQFGEEHPDTATIYNSLGKYHLRIGKMEESIGYFEKTLVIRQKVYPAKHELLADIYRNFSEVNLLQKQQIAALEYIQKTVISFVFDFDDEDIFTNPNLKSKVIEIKGFTDVLIKKAEIAFAIYSHNNRQTQYLLLAAKTYLLLDAFLTQFRQSQIEEAAKFTLAAQAQRIYANAMNVLQSCKPLKEASVIGAKWNLHTLFKFSEKSKAILLYQKIQESTAKNAALMNTELLKEEQNLAFQLNALNLQLKRAEIQGDNANQEQVEKWRNQYLETLEAHKKLIQQFEKNYPEYYQLKFNTEVVGLETLQSQISSNALMIEYFIGNEYLYLFGITSNAVEILQVAKPSNFDQLIAGFNKSIHQIRKKKYIQLGVQLYDLLLKPILTKLQNVKVEQLILIPHGILTTLPFEALLCSESEIRSSYTDFDYLLMHYDVSYHYSATLWSYGLKQQKNKPNLTESFIGFAPVYSDKNSEVSSKLILEESYRSVRIGGDEYQELIYSEEEVQGVQQAFERKGVTAQTFLHGRATKSDFAANVQAKKYVLIAAHGVHNKEQPELSGIIFSPNGRQSAEEAVLYVDDAYHLKLDADLVVLSSCESGIGKLAKGEGMMAINRGFLYAGASNVIFTLFKVYDKQSSQLTQLLFDAILNGKNYAEALRWAKLQLIQQQDIDPKAWSGFVLIGG